MPFPDKCIIRKGLFPETAHGIADTFAFVSIDADLSGPTLDGLNFFYPRLNGGYIFIHDYNNTDWPGIKEAVSEFCRKNKATPIPLPDAWGTVVLVK